MITDSGDMVERVARIIEPSAWLLLDLWNGNHKKLDDWHQAEIVSSTKKARAVIEAMREPTEGMVKSGGNHIPWEEGWGKPDKNISNVWAAMIYSALHPSA